MRPTDSTTVSRARRCTEADAVSDSGRQAFYLDWSSSIDQSVVGEGMPRRQNGRQTSIEHRPGEKNLRFNFRKQSSDDQCQWKPPVY